MSSILAATSCRGAAGEEGIYCEGTRFLSRFELLIFDHRPLLLSSTQSGDDALFEADLTNADVVRDGHGRIGRGQINLRRSRVLLTSRCVERIRVTYYGFDRLVVPLTIRMDADFADVFEVRGTHRAARGVRMRDVPGDDYVMGYRGLDQVERRARVAWSRRPDAIERGTLRFLLPLEPDTPTMIDVSVSYETSSASLNRQAKLRRGARTRTRTVGQLLARCRVISRRRAAPSTAGSIGRPPTSRS